MPSSRPRARCCGLCGAVRVWVGDEHSVSIRLRMCPHCDAPDCKASGFPQGFDPATWEINQRRRERGEIS